MHLRRLHILVALCVTRIDIMQCFGIQRKANIGESKQPNIYNKNTDGVINILNNNTIISHRLKRQAQKSTNWDAWTGNSAQTRATLSELLRNSFQGDRRHFGFLQSSPQQPTHVADNIPSSGLQPNSSQFLTHNEEHISSQWTLEDLTAAGAIVWLPPNITSSWNDEDVAENPAITGKIPTANTRPEWVKTNAGANTNQAWVQIAPDVLVPQGTPFIKMFTDAQKTATQGPSLAELEISPDKLQSNSNTGTQKGSLSSQDDSLDPLFPEEPNLNSNLLLVNNNGGTDSSVSDKDTINQNSNRGKTISSLGILKEWVKKHPRLAALLSLGGRGKNIQRNVLPIANLGIQLPKTVRNVNDINKINHRLLENVQPVTKRLKSDTNRPLRILRINVRAKNTAKPKSRSLDKGLFTRNPKHVGEPRFDTRPFSKQNPSNRIITKHPGRPMLDTRPFSKQNPSNRIITKHVGEPRLGTRPFSKQANTNRITTKHVSKSPLDTRIASKQANVHRITANNFGESRRGTHNLNRQTFANMIRAKHTGEGRFVTRPVGKQTNVNRITAKPVIQSTMTRNIPLILKGSDQISLVNVGQTQTTNNRQINVAASPPQSRNVNIFRNVGSQLRPRGQSIGKVFRTNNQQTNKKPAVTNFSTVTEISTRPVKTVSVPYIGGSIDTEF